jgi:hypothetical protein
MSERWEPKRRELYYFISESLVAEVDCNEHTFTDKERIYCANCFRTEEEAEAAAEKVKALLLSLHNTTQVTTQVTTQDEALPKLTAEVFNRPDCPEWAKWAAVDMSGVAFFYENKPIFTGTCYQSIIGGTKIIDSSIKWDITNCQNILIECPVKLPDWCKVGGYGYDYASGYFKIVEIIDCECNLKVEWVKEGVQGTVFGCNLKCKKQARLRPYNAEEMRGLVGKVLCDTDGNMELVTGWSVDINIVRICQIHYSAERLLNNKFTIDGKPCGVLEHLENEEWVE